MRGREGWGEKKGWCINLSSCHVKLQAWRGEVRREGRGGGGKGGDRKEGKGGSDGESKGELRGGGQR